MLIADIAGAVLTTSRLRIIDWTGAVHEAGPADAPLVGVVRIRTAKAARRIAFDPPLALGEAWVDGDFQMVEGDLVDVITALLHDLGSGGTHWSLKWRHRLLGLLRAWHELNSPDQARRHIAHHYDLDWDFYRLWLDAEGHYSCAFYVAPEVSLEEAQREKAARIAAKLALRAGDRVLDIGCGWGAMALYLARNFDVSVTGISLSRAQLAVAERRAAEAGLSHRLRFEYADYREHAARYDRIVSVGMLEHVGAPNLQEYFGVVRRNLTEDGVALIHTIGRVGPPAATNPWIRKHIFPGGFIPSLSEIAGAVERQRLISTDVETLRLHYGRTLREWRRRFNAHRAEFTARFSEEFCRMWEFYLIISEASFLSGAHVNYQVQLARSLEAIPLSRDYLYSSNQATPPRRAARVGEGRAAARRDSVASAKSA